MMLSIDKIGRRLCREEVDPRGLQTRAEESFKVRRLEVCLHGGVPRRTANPAAERRTSLPGSSR